VLGASARPVMELTTHVRKGTERRCRAEVHILLGGIICGCWREKVVRGEGPKRRWSKVIPEMT
jgi:hypothetical protein